MHPTKAPDSNGMPPLFFQCHWHIVDPSITKALLDALNLGQIPKDLNHTYFTLIPKKAQPQSITDYRPISLCNILYKLISKVISNRIKSLLPIVVYNSQSTFVLGIQITDNILVAYEVIHFLIRKTKGKQGFMSLKLDMSKIYNRVE